MNLEKLETTVGYFRFMSIIAVAASIFGSFLMFCIGALKVYRAYEGFFFPGSVAGTPPPVKADASITYLVQAMDAFLVALVLMIFGGGVYNLFVRAVDASKHASHRLFQIQSMADLKLILAELVIVILMVKFLEGTLDTENGYLWQLLIRPVGVSMLAAAAHILSDSHE